MRTTLDIDTDVLQTVKELAKTKGKTTGKVLSELARIRCALEPWKLALQQNTLHHAHHA